MMTTGPWSLFSVVVPELILAPYYSWFLFIHCLSFCSCSFPCSCLSILLSATSILLHCFYTHQPVSYADTLMSSGLCRAKPPLVGLLTLGQGSFRPANKNSPSPTKHVQQILHNAPRYPITTPTGHAIAATDGETRAVGEPGPPAGLLQNCLFGQFSSRPSTMTLSIQCTAGVLEISLF